jgi:hypothetical protein
VDRRTSDCETAEQAGSPVAALCHGPTDRSALLWMAPTLQGTGPPPPAHTATSRSLPRATAVATLRPGVWSQNWNFLCARELPPPPPVSSSARCDWVEDTQIGVESWMERTGSEAQSLPSGHVFVTTREECCGACFDKTWCGTAVFSGSFCWFYTVAQDAAATYAPRKGMTTCRVQKAFLHPHPPPPTPPPPSPPPPTPV